jgi:hypothetical protein
VSADLALDGPRWRHAVQYVRLRDDLQASDLRTLRTAARTYQGALDQLTHQAGLAAGRKT